MPWAKFDDKFNSHPKVVAAGPLAVALHMRAIVYCAQYLTDGIIRRRTLRHIVSWDDDADDFSGRPPDNLALAKRLVNAGLWDEAPDGEGWLIHDYLHYNPSRQEWTEAQRSKVDAGRKGGLASGAARRKQTRSKPEATAEARASHLLEPNAKHVLRPASILLRDQAADADLSTAEQVTSSDDFFKNGSEGTAVSAQKIVAQAKQRRSTCFASASRFVEAKPKPVPDPYRSNTIMEASDVTPAGASRLMVDDGQGQPGPAPEPVALIPVFGGDHPVTASDLDDWTAAYPDVDVPAQLAAMRQWCLSNPQRKKTKVDVRRFITGWLGRQQDGPPQRPQHTACSDAAAAAWPEVLQLASRSSGDHSDAAAAQAIRRLGGGSALGRLHGNELAAYRTRFFEAYDQAASELSDAPGAPSGDVAADA